jgi:hypothetical protein
MSLRSTATLWAFPSTSMGRKSTSCGFVPHPPSPKTYWHCINFIINLYNFHVTSDLKHCCAAARPRKTFFDSSLVIWPYNDGIMPGICLGICLFERARAWSRARSLETHGGSSELVHLALIRGLHAVIQRSRSLRVWVCMAACGAKCGCASGSFQQSGHRAAPSGTPKCCLNANGIPWRRSETPFFINI